jgi:hypothetical protein
VLTLGCDLRFIEQVIRSVKAEEFDRFVVFFSALFEGMRNGSRFAWSDGTANGVVGWASANEKAIGAEWYSSPEADAKLDEKQQ